MRIIAVLCVGMKIKLSVFSNNRLLRRFWCLIKLQEINVINTGECSLFVVDHQQHRIHRQTCFINDCIPVQLRL